MPNAKERNYSCKLCNKQFFTHACLIRHGLVHSEERPFKCPTCSKGFKSEREVKVHVVTHDASRPRPFKCHLCDKHFHSKVARAGHRRTHREPTIQCPKCDCKFTSKSQVTSHLLTHTDARPFPCTLCDAAFKCRSNLSQHVNRVHVQIKEFTCSSSGCARSYKCELTFKAHVRVHSRENWSQCSRCPRSFPTARKLVQHHKRQHAEVSGLLCTFPNCWYAAADAGNLKSHMSSHGDKSHKCDKCPAVFQKESRLRTHLQRHLQTRLRQLRCAMCSYATFHASGLQAHTLRAHTNERPYSCSRCPKTFKTLREVRCHSMRAHPKGDRMTVTCNVCHKVLAHEDSLKQHLKVHAEDRVKYHCETCGNAYLTRTQLIVHVRRAHTGETPFKCPLCPREFSAREYLSQHAITHTNEQPHVCRHCGKSFADRRVCKRHEMVHEGTFPHACDICGKKARRKSQIRIHKQKHHADNVTIDLLP